MVVIVVRIRYKFNCAAYKHSDFDIEKESDILHVHIIVLHLYT